MPEKLGAISYYGHILSVVPNNILQPFLSGNVLSVLLIAVSEHFRAGGIKMFFLVIVDKTVMRW